MEESPRHVPEKLDKAQIEFAWDLIDEFHPISKTPLHVAYPLVGWFCKCSTCCGRNEIDTSANQSTLNDELLPNKTAIVKGKNGKEIVLKKKPKKKAKQMSEEEAMDPINLLGFGIVAYRTYCTT